MKFCTAINCMDGRVQLPVINYLTTRFNAPYVDSISEAGICALLAQNADDSIMENIFNKITISYNRKSFGMAVVGHYGCIGNPTSKETQVGQIKKSINLLESKYDNVEIIGLWVDEDFKVIEL